MNIKFYRWRFRWARLGLRLVVEFSELGIDPPIYRQIIGPQFKSIPCHRCRGAGDLYSTFSIHGRFCEECGGCGRETSIGAARDPENQERWKRRRLERYSDNWKRFSRTGKWFSPWWNGGPA